MIVDLVRKAREIGVKCTARDELRGFAPIGAKPLSSIPPSSLFRGCGVGPGQKDGPCQACTYCRSGIILTFLEDNKII
jgi:hypothetical protein